MRNKFIKIIFIFILLLLIVCITKSVQANSIKQINMDIYVDETGNAHVTETWTCTADEGTEVYHPYYNLGNSQITDLKVSEGTTRYTSLEEWNTSGNFTSKSYKCGINKISDGVELCWGISKYGAHTYTAQYLISNFVSELKDSQMIYWTLIPHSFSEAIQDVKIKIHSDKYINDTIDVWGYGNYGGLAYVSEGAIYMDSDGTLDKNEYMTILVKFPLETFNCSNSLSNDFEHYFEMAQEGAEAYVEEDFSWIAGIFTFLVMAIPFFVAIASAKGARDFDFGPEGKKIPKKVDYYRDIPVNGDLYKAYYIAFNYGIMKNKTDLLGAILLKWLKEGIVEVTKIEKKGLKKKDDTAIAFKQQTHNFENARDTKLYNMLYEASKDGILEKKELEKWCRGKYSKILDWFDDILKDEKQVIIDEGLVTNTSNNSKKKKYVATTELKQIALELAGLKRYLKEYTLIKDREAMQVMLFEDYLIYAQLFGIAKEVAKEFKDLYPELIEQSHYSSYDDILFIHYCSASGISSANSARAAAQSYSSGGGGFSSGGGGGGSFGGGGGGGGFR